ncbi:MAG: hypothetical protein Q8R11_01775 [bacterium]|nr:hypothetical protein [bacterium]
MTIEIKTRQGERLRSAFSNEDPANLEQYPYVYMPEPLDQFIETKVPPEHQRTFKILTHLAGPVSDLHAVLKSRFYPEQKRRTNESIEGAAQNNPALLSPYTAVAERFDRTFKVIPFQEHREIEPLLIECQDLLHAAADSSDHLRLRHYLRLLGERIRWGDYLGATKLWVQHEHLPLHVQFGPLESYFDTRFGKKCSFQLTLGVLDEEATRKYTAMRDAFVQEHPLIHELLQYQPAEVGKVTVEAIQAAIYAGVMAEKKFVGEAIPNHPDQQKAWGARILLIPNQYVIRFRDIFYAIQRHIDGRLADEFPSESELRDMSLGGLVNTEEQAHFWIRMEGARDRLKGQYNLLNECVACMLPLTVAARQWSEGRLPERQFRALLIAQMGSTLVKMDQGMFKDSVNIEDPLSAFIGKEHDARNLIIFCRLIRDRAVMVDEFGKIVDIRPKVALDVLQAMCQTYAGLYRSAKVEEVTRFVSWDLSFLLKSETFRMIQHASIGEVVEPVAIPGVALEQQIVRYGHENNSSVAAG